ncbi:hypothetical protein FHX08_002093 [Rhizobium sp. BK529]|uniref:hypothetical protein n=1 Tax=Rhizobium sp. BK529 TaxID=2586983 RepID=UPI00160DC734|nr:hypothetical protein [Rhizobium sp. BK529]MBB3591749.1 hypothetical protein [Rhizobium sp. BK529]
MSRFDEIRLFENYIVRWRFLSKPENRWEISAYNGAARNERLLTSVTGDVIRRYSVGGPGTSEFSEALGIVVLSASLKVQSNRINGPSRQL